MSAISASLSRREQIGAAEKAIQRFLAASLSGKQPEANDRDEAQAHLEAVLGDATVPRGQREKASFLLGGMLLTEHESRCSKSAADTAELREIVPILQISGSRDAAQSRYLYLYATAVEMLADHTGDPADLERAIVWLTRAAADWGQSRPDRRHLRLRLGVQYSKQAAALVTGGSPSVPGSDSWAAYNSAISQYEAVLAKLSGPGRRSDENRNENRLDACLELIEAYYNRAGERPLSEAELSAITGPARQVVREMTPDYPRRSFALGRAGTVLLQRIARVAGDTSDAELEAAVLSGRFDEVCASFRVVPDLDQDLDLAIPALDQATQLEGQRNWLQPIFTLAYCSALSARFLAHQADSDMLEIGRLARLVLGRPDIKAAYRYQCATYLWTALATRLRASGQLAEPEAEAQSPAQPLSPTAAAEIDTMISLLGRYAFSEADQADQKLAVVFITLAASRAEAAITEAELADAWARLTEAAASFAHLPAVQAMTLFQAATIGATWVRRGTAPDGLADQVTAAFAQAEAGLPRGHGTGRQIASQAASFEEFRRTAAGPAKPAAAPDQPHLDWSDQPEVDLHAAALIGAPSQGRLAASGGRILELLQPHLASPPADPRLRAVVNSVQALARHDRWLRERTSADLALAIKLVAAAAELQETGALRRRLDQLLAGLLLDRGQADGSQADTDAAVEILRRLLSRATGSQPPEDLNVLLTQGLGQLSQSDSQPAPGALLADYSAGESNAAAYTCGLRAMLGSALLARAVAAGADGDLAAAIAELRASARHLPGSHPRYPDTQSDLGLAELLASRRHSSRTASQLAVTALVSAATSCPESHPRRPMIMLRAAGALMADSHPADPADLDQAIEILRQALETAGLNAAGEWSRCLYGLGYALLLRYQRTGSRSGLDEATSALEDARTALIAVPGDPLLIPLLQTLALAYRAGGPGLRRRQSLSTARSLLHEHARAVLIQSGTIHGLAAARRIGADTVRLADWCLADGDCAGAVEALELGRGLVLHSATVSADISKLLREQKALTLADEWERAAEVQGGDPGSSAPSDLRGRVLTALAGSQAELRLISAPTVSDIAASLASARIDSLAYLIPASASAIGRALIVDADGTATQLELPGLASGPTGPLATFVAVQRAFVLAEENSGLQAGPPPTPLELDLAIGGLCDWAWTAAMGPLLGRAGAGASAGLPRVVIVPVGALGIVPWHAARRELESGELRYACADAVLSTCASARQLSDAIARGPVRPGQPKVIVANPTGDLPLAGQEADSLCSVVYPDAVHLGLSEKLPVSGPGDPAEVLAYLPGSAAGREAGLLHLGCHALAGDQPDQSRLGLSGGDLTLSEILAQARSRGGGRNGGLVVLSACRSDVTVTDHDEALTLASAFLAAGTVGVVGSRWRVRDNYTAMLMYVMHYYLASHPAEGAARALRAAQLWMIDSGRQAPAGMPDELTALVRRSTAARPIAWAAFTYHGP